MKFSATLFVTAVLATSSFAAPLTGKRQARHESRAKGERTNRKTNPAANKHNGTLEEQYSSNWAGAVLVNSGYTGVSAEFTVPTPQMPPGGSPSTQYCASAWVGIDGDTCQSAILQTGIDFCVQYGQPSYAAWYEWYPEYAYDFTGISISAGDVISISVDASSTNTGTAIVENLSTGQSVSHTFNGGTTGTLCETNAEWIVEDFEENGALVPFANFGSVTFSNAQAIQYGQYVGPSGAQIMDIEQNGQVLTQSSDTSNSVTVQYIG